MKAEVYDNKRLQGDYFRIRFKAPEIAEKSMPGQFVHLRIDQRDDRILRRPFSIHNAEKGLLTVVYKVVGHGTRRMSALLPGDKCDILGPLGQGFTAPPAGHIPVAVCGGYGSAATFMLTKISDTPGVLLLGARSDIDVILTDVYAEKGYDVRVATDDGTMGHKGRVTELIPRLIAENPGKKFFFYGCGPHPMLMALATMLRELKLDGELSIDQLMCCGVGACFGCVVKVNDDSSEKGWKYVRSCMEGPVFKLKDVYVEK